jgi:hypothetical protein
MKALFVGTQCSASDALYSVCRRRFDRQFPTSGLQSLNQRLDLAAGFCGNVIAQPSRQHLGIGDRGLAEAESGSNLGAKAFCRSLCERQTGICGDWQLDLSRQGGDIHRFQIGWDAREASIVAEENQPRRKSESVVPALGHHQGVIAGGQHL